MFMVLERWSLNFLYRKRSVLYLNYKSAIMFYRIRFMFMNLCDCTVNSLAVCLVLGPFVGPDTRYNNGHSLSAPKLP